MKNALVDIVMVTYNHELFIAEAIESILQQKCNFNFRIIIADDCSIDQTRKTCVMYASKHPDKILLIQQPHNVGLVLNYKSAFEACTAEFISILEGDDYWIDPTKLQRQVDVLNTNLSVGLVHTGFVVKESDGLIRKAHLGIDLSQLEGDLYESVMNDKAVFCPLTVVFRRNLLSKVDYEFCIVNKVWTIDAFLWPEFSKQASIKYLPEITGVYRRVASAATSTIEPTKLIWYYKTGLAMKLYYLKKYPIESLSQQAVEQRFLQQLVKKLIQVDSKSELREYLVKLRVHDFKTLKLKLAGSSDLLQRLYRMEDIIIQALSKIKQKLLA